MGDYYCYDNPAAMHTFLNERFTSGGSSSFDFEIMFNLFYSVYSLPNILLPILGGILIFKFGYRIMFIIFCFLILIGQFIFAFGCSFKSVNIMLIGRVLFGFGGDSLNIAQFAVIIQWFSQKEIAFAMGICMGVARLGRVLNDVISPRMAVVSV